MSPNFVQHHLLHFFITPCVFINNETYKIIHKPEEQAKLNNDQSFPSHLLLLLKVGSVGLVGSLLVLVSLLIGVGLLLVRDLLLVSQSLPLLTEKLTDLAKGDTGVIGSDTVTVVVGEEHVGGQGSLGGVGVYALVTCWDASRLVASNGTASPSKFLGKKAGRQRRQLLLVLILTLLLLAGGLSGSSGGGGILRHLG